MSYQQMKHQKRQPTAKQGKPTGKPGQSADIITFTDGVGHILPIEPGDVLEEDDRYYTTRKPTSAVHWTTQQAAAQGGVQVAHHYYDQSYQQGFIQRRSRAATHAPDEQETRRPVSRIRPKPKLKFHWLVYLGLGLLLMFVSYIALNHLSSWWQTHQDDATYGNPRTFQIDAVVGHFDSASNPTHFIAINLHGQVIVIELPGGDTSKARSYNITTIPDNSSNPPVRLAFQDLLHHGKLDLVVEIGDPGNAVTIFFYNNGSQFVPKL